MAYEFKLHRQVEFAETDMAGIVHFSNFFRYMEQTEHAFLRSLGLSVHTPTADGAISFPRVRTACEYKQPLRFEDELEVHLLVRQKKEKAIVYEFTFKKLTPKSPVEVAHGSMTVVCAKIDRNDQIHSVSIPASIAERIEVADGE